MQDFFDYLGASKLNETLSDKCIYELIIRSKESSQCRVSPSCYNEMVIVNQNKDAGYGITHK